MADVGDELLDGDFEETPFQELDGEEEDALLADDEYVSFEVSENAEDRVYTSSSQECVASEQLMRVVNHVQDVTEGDEIIEEGPEDILELAVVDELDESELDNSHTNNKVWSEPSSAVNDSVEMDQSVGVTSSTNNISALGAESDEEEKESRRSRFKTERTNIISLKSSKSGASLAGIPDTLDQVKTPVLKGHSPKGRGNVRGRLGPIPQGGMMRRGFGPMNRPNQPLHPQHPAPKIHVNPHFGQRPQEPNPGWLGNARPPPQVNSFNSPQTPPKQMNWRGPTQPYMGEMRPPFPPHHPGAMPQFQGPQPIFNSQPQGFVGHPPAPAVVNHHELNNPDRIVQFSNNSQLVTVENRHFQRPPMGPNYGSNNNVYQPLPQNIPPNFNNGGFPNHPESMPAAPNFQPHSFSPANIPPNYGDYPPQHIHPQSNHGFQNFNNQNAWNHQQSPVYQQNHQPLPMQPPAAPDGFHNPAQAQFRCPYPVNQNNVRMPQQPQFQRNARGVVVKRVMMRKATTPSPVPAKLMRFENNKVKPTQNIIRSNLQEIRTVDNLPDTTTTQEPEPEEDEETKQYRKKIAEQKALREKILQEKEARRLASIVEKQKQHDTSLINVPATIVKRMTTPHSKHQTSNLLQLKTQMKTLNPGHGNKFTVSSTNKPIIRKNVANSGAPVVQMQQMLGTMYKIVKVRTKEGAIVTRKTPVVSANAPGHQRRIVLNTSGQNSVGSSAIIGQPGGAIRMTSNINSQGRTLLTLQTTSQTYLPKTTQRVVLNKAPVMKLATTPALPVSSLVTIDNLSVSTSALQIKKLAAQAGRVTSIKLEIEKKRATLKFSQPKEAEQFYLKFHRKMVDLSRIIVNVVPE